MAQDRYRYFRIEARELIEGLTAGLLALDRPGVDGADAAVDRLLRLAHTLKGAARVVGVGAVADAAHALEDLLATHRAPDGARPAPPVAEEGLLLIDAMAAAVDRLDAAPANGPGPAVAPAGEPGVETVRVAIAAMDGLIEDLAEAASQLDGLQRQASEWHALSRQANGLVAALAGAPAATRALAAALAGRLEQTRRGLAGGLDRAADELENARERAQGLRLVPASMVFSQLERAALDAGRDRGVPVRFEAVGGETRLDGPVLLQLRDALLHGVRNAVAHGLEPERERLASGKPGVGRVRVHVERQGGRVVIRCEDDGRGMDSAALRQAAVRLRLASAAEAAAASDEEALRWSFQAGLSTRGTVTELAGRGVGLDAVQAIADGLKGEATLTSEPGRGTVLTLTVPISLAALPALIVEAGGQVAAVPLDAVVSTFRLAAIDVAIVAGRRTTWHDGRSMPVVYLESALAPEAVPSAGPMGSAVHVRTRAGEAVLGVDRVHRLGEVLVRPLPALIGRLPLVSGAFFDPEGVPQPVIDVAGLVAAAPNADARPRPEPARPPILVVDDSLTTRMLEASILEVAGYDVALAASAEEALELARVRRFGLFVVDVEMPGMSGFEFVEVTRRDPALAATPAILVTSRDSEADRQRGVRSGASGYIVKGEFDQDRFLALVGRLMG